MSENIYTSADSDSTLDLDDTMLLEEKYTKFKHSLLLRIMAISATLTALFATLDALGFHDMGATQRYYNYFFSISSFTTAILLYKQSIKFESACNVFLLLCYLGSIWAVLSVVEDDFRAIWFFLSIFFAFMLRGVTIGYLFTISAILALITIQFFAGETYSSLSFITIIIALSFFSISLSSFTKQMAKYREQLRKQSIELHYLANKDPLTDALNSKSHFELAKSMLIKAKETQGDLSMLCVYVDNLAFIHQKYGAQIEVPLLTHVEKLMNEQLYSKGDIAKISQQEYCILLPEYDTLGAQSIAQHINESVQKNLFSTDKNKIPVTLSIGISSLSEGDNEIRSIQVRADKALNRAKQHGGNKTFTYSA